MNALLLSEYKHLEIADLPIPVPGPFEVLVQVAACGICGSDVHGYDGTSGRRIPPLVMGHEAAGTIAAVGSQVRGFVIGDRVTFDSTVYCGECALLPQRRDESLRQPSGYRGLLRRLQPCRRLRRICCRARPHRLQASRKSGIRRSGNAGSCLGGAFTRWPSRSSTAERPPW